MKYTFHAFGHKNIRGTHKNTFEFTKEKEVTLQGDCIIGVNANFDSNELKKFLSKSKNIKITISDGKNIDEVLTEVNKEFDDGKELVIRKTDFLSKRTFGIKANKAAIDLNKTFLTILRNPESKVTVILENMP